MLDSSLKVAIVGASGYVGAELVALLSEHPAVGETVYVSRALAGVSVEDHFRPLRGRVSAKFVAPSPSAFANCDVVFFATPHAVAMNEASALLEAGAVVIDLSPDFRLRDAEVFKQWYGEHSTVSLLSQSVYGLTEVAHSSLKSASLIACPGCYATAIELSLIPLAAANVINGVVIADCKSGVSGAGKRSDRSDLLFAEQSENFKAYAVDGHRHQPEIEQTVNDVAGRMPNMIFVPHLLPTARGIYATLYIPVDKQSDCAALMRDYWRDKIFIDVLEDGVPSLSEVAHTNRVQLCVKQKTEDIVLVIAALDNLQKGAAGQAIQNMNVRFGISESAGLSGARIK